MGLACFLLDMLPSQSSKVRAKSGDDSSEAHVGAQKTHNWQKSAVKIF